MAATLRAKGLQHCFHLYFFFLCLVTACMGAYNLYLRSDWSIADWLINYSGGFVRRGFTGQLALTVARLGVSPFAVILVLQYLLYAAIFFTVWHLLRNARWPLWLLAMVYSPATLAFQVNDPTFGFRKEILFLAELSLLLLFLRRDTLRDRWLVFYLCLFNTACILSHEALIVYLPYLLCALFAAFRSVRRTLVCGLPVIVTSAGSAALVSHFQGDLSASRAICGSLGGTLMSAPASFCSGAIAYLGNDSSFAHAQVVRTIHTEHYATLFPRLILLSLLPALMAAITLWRQRALRAPLLALALTVSVAAGASAVLFLYGTDWTRWIYIHIFSIFLILLFLNAKLQQDSAGESSDPLLPAGRAGRLITYALLLCYIFGWHLATYQPRVPFGGLIHYAMQQRKFRPPPASL